MGSPADFKAMIDLLNTHNIVPVVDEVFALADAAKAVAKMEHSTQFGKIALSI